MREKLFIVITFISSVLYAQPRPFLEEGKTWTVVHHQAGRILLTVTYSLKNDTVIDRTRWFRLYEDEKFFAAYREEEGKVYFTRSLKEVKSELMFDFSARKGDVVTIGYTFGDEEQADGSSAGGWHTSTQTSSEEATYRVKATGIGSSAGRKYKSLELQDISSQKTALWIEGIGDACSGPAGDYYNHIGPGSLYLLTECRVGDDIIYTASIDDNFHYVEDDTDITLPTIRTKPSRPLYDLQGRPQQKLPSSGVFVKDGKKLVKARLNP